MADYWLAGFRVHELEATMPIQATEPSLILPTKRASMSLQAVLVGESLASVFCLTKTGIPRP